MKFKTYSPHKLELLANIYELGCLPGKYEKINKKDLDKKCKEIDKEYKEECDEEMWSTFIICYNSKLEGDDERIELKNKEGGNKCKKPRQHAIDMRVCARRKSFKRDNAKNEYKIEYNVYSKIGFSFTHKSFSFQNSVTVTGLINKTNGFMEPPSKDNATFTVFTIKLGTEDTFFATLTGINGKKLDYGSSTKYRINLLFSKRDGHKENSFQMIAEGNEAISLLGLDMELWNYFSRLYDEMEFPSKSCHLTLKLDGYKFHTTSHCDMFFTNQNFVTNRIEVWGLLLDLACNTAEAKEQRLSGIEASETCKYKSGNLNGMRDDYAQACSNYEDGDDQQKHGIEFRIYATRIGFERLEEEYWVKVAVNVVVGLSHILEVKIEFDKTFKLTGKIGTLYAEEPYLGSLIDQDYILLFSIQLGNNGTNFAILTDEMNGNVYDYGSSVIANLEHKNIKEIVEEGGAIAMIGPDMNLQGKLMFATNFEFLSVSKHACTGTVDLKLNIYKRPPTQCDQMGLEEYKKYNNSYYELLELYEKCNCDREPRPASIPEERLIIRPEVRGKRSLKDDPLLGTRDAYGLVYGCEDSVDLVFDDVEMYPEEIALKIESQRECKFEKFRTS
uniref:Uncharacterized protein n=1 Tax=Meloidogyne javanica TaxID=6303 RepID=A0A915MZW0_MELJA